MVSRWPPRRMLVIAGVLLLLGALLPFLMVIRVLPSRWWLNILSYSATVAGAFLGYLGILTYLQRHRRRRR
ncbi:MAG: hypothetical protein GXO36_06665 [Chloroflexi bacterium]|nr:hypothetical protein [Chloroflexota bacterium]